MPGVDGMAGLAGALPLALLDAVDADEDLDDDETVGELDVSVLIFSNILRIKLTFSFLFRHMRCMGKLSYIALVRFFDDLR